MGGRKRGAPALERGGEQDAPPAPWSHDDIMRVARRVMDDARSAEDKLRAAYSEPGEFRDFFDAYPKLFQVCCRARGAAERADVEQHLTFMLSSISRHAGAPELASRTVHTMLTERYINPVAQRLPVPPEALARARAEASAAAAADS